MDFAPMNGSCYLELFWFLSLLLDSLFLKLELPLLGLLSLTIRGLFCSSSSLIAPSLALSLIKL